MNFKGIKRAEELRLNIENQDREIIELEKVMYSLATQDGQGLTLSLSVSSPECNGLTKKQVEQYKSGGYTGNDYRSLSVFDTAPAGFLSGIFGAMQEVVENEAKERIVKAPSRSSFVITNGMALEFLAIYHKKLIGERALAFKLLEECIKTLKVLD